ncbi:MAG: hypothetical protein ABJA70_08225 [Chryseolinea sp.]
MKEAVVLSFSYGFSNCRPRGKPYVDDNHIDFRPLYAKYDHSILEEVHLSGKMAFAVARKMAILSMTISGHCPALLG